MTSDLCSGIWPEGNSSEGFLSILIGLVESKYQYMFYLCALEVDFNGVIPYCGGTV